jgi:hypothetical protein
MKRTIVSAVLIAGIALVALSGVALAQGPYGGNPMGRGMMSGGMMGGGMMGGGMMGGNGLGPTQTITPTVPFGNGWGWGMMGSGMMGGWGSNGATNGAAITLDQAVTQMQSYVASIGNPDLKLVEVEEYTLNFYGVVQEKSTGTDAFQIIEDKFGGTVYPEMGPNMMWNTKYSPMARMMGGLWFGVPSGKMTVSVDQARAGANEFLKKYMPNTSLEAATDTYYGYYNIDVLQNGKTYGMLSVNGYSGAVWYHTWHGEFVAAREVE